MKNEILNILKTEKPTLAKEFGVEEIGVFGSVERNTDSEESDIDIMVKLKKATFSAMMGLLIYLEKRLDRKVDLVRKGNHLPERFMKQVERDIIYV